MRVACLGAGGMIGGSLTERLVADGHDVVAVDIKPLDEWYLTSPDAISVQADMRDHIAACEVVAGCEWVMNLACDMGGIGYIEGQRANCALSTLITANVLRACHEENVARLFYSSSACVYSAHHQGDAHAIPLAEHHDHPLAPEPGYGEEKWWGERMHILAGEDWPIDTRIARYHNIYSGGPTTWRGGKEKAPAAVCRKVAEAALTGADHVEVWGDGKATRSYCWIDDCIDGTLRLMESDHAQPLNIGSEELISVDDLYRLVMGIAGVELELRHDLSAPQGVRGRNSDNALCREVLGWEPTTALAEGLAHLYAWVAEQVATDEPRCGFA